MCKTKISPPVGLEPTTFELEVQHASPLRHGGFTLVPYYIFALFFWCFILFLVYYFGGYETLRF